MGGLLFAFDWFVVGFCFRLFVCCDLLCVTILFDFVVACWTAYTDTDVPPVSAE